MPGKFYVRTEYSKYSGQNAYKSATTQTRTTSPGFMIMGLYISRKLKN